MDNSNSETHPVATKSPNSLGLYDMTGNVKEWCSDWFGLYTSDSQTNPQGPSSGSARVLRGGSWKTYAQGSRVSFRHLDGSESSNANAGFRLVLSE